MIQHPNVTAIRKYCAVCNKLLKAGKKMKNHVKAKEHKTMKRFGIPHVTGW